MRIFVFVFATANLILDLLWRGSQIGDFDPEGFSAESHVTHRLLWAYGVCLLFQGCCVPTAMINMIGSLLKFYSNEVAALTSTKQKIFQERYHASAK